jgi:hypothetical protein
MATSGTGILPVTAAKTAPRITTREWAECLHRLVANSYSEPTGARRSALAQGPGPPAALEEVAALGEFLADRLPALLEEWHALRRSARPARPE